ncbi:MAG: transcriptional repressor, partial [Patescibacteria group bacterium]|nr:transcriptional repressor [Patescibacteria group bacterium]
TMQRRAILDAVLRRGDHPTADAVYEAVQASIPQLSRTTVYRVLDTLVEMGLIRRVHQAGVARFDGNVNHHHHLVCTTCGKIIDVEELAVEELPLPGSKIQGFIIDDFSIHFSGTCSECQKQEE